MSKNIISIKNLSKKFGANQEVIAVDNVNLEIEEGSFTVILGRSGSGKSTLLNILAGLDTPTNGEIVVNDDNLQKYTSRQLAKYRSKIGMVFQNYNLLPDLNVLENVLIASWVSNHPTTIEEAKNYLSKIGLKHRINANIKTLSGGEKQRVAIVRALINKPKILFCDEPTGALDTTNENQIIKILKDLNVEEKISIIMVTHNPEFTKIATQIINMVDGKIVENIKK